MTHSARRPGRRSRGHSGRRPWRGRRGHGGGRRSPGCRQHRSARRGRLGTAAGQRPAMEGQGHEGRPRAHQPDSGRLSAHPPGRTGMRPPTWPAHSHSSQCSPVQPRPQEQLPLAAWHRPPFLQEHVCSQLTPNRFRGQPADRGRALSSGPRLDTPQTHPHQV